MNEIQKPEQVDPKPVEMQQFSGAAKEMIEDFSLLHTNGLGTEGGAITVDSLQLALSKLEEEAVRDSSVRELLGTLNTARSTKEEDTAKRVAPEDTAEFALLKMFGAVEERASIVVTPEASTQPQQRIRKFGHQVLVDGRVVEGLMVPGRNEVVTAHGALRTRGTPRSNNR